MVSKEHLKLVGAVVATIVVFFALRAAYYFIVPQQDKEVKITISIVNSGSDDRPVIVFIHGIQGDSDVTWRNAKTNTTFMELLASHPDFKEYQIVSIDYPTGIVGSYAQITDIAKEVSDYLSEQVFDKHHSSIIVGHSMGGIVARSAIQQSSFQTEHTSHNLSLITLATPFDGSKMPKALVGTGFQSEQLEKLAVGSETLKQLRLLWEPFAKSNKHRIQQYAAYETEKEVTDASILVVDRNSATHAIPLGNIYAATGESHLSIARPSSIAQGIGGKVVEWIKSSGDMVLDGEVTYKTTLFRRANSTTIIKPGTRINLVDGASIVFEGKVLAQGAEDDPIRFVLDRESEEGGILLLHQGASDSVFQHVKFSGGRGTRYDYPDPQKDSGHVEYTETNTCLYSERPPQGGQLSLVNCSRVMISDCEFEFGQAWRGGAVCSIGAVDLKLEDSVFHKNISGYGGGALFVQCTTASISGCEFSNNHSGENANAFNEEKRRTLKKHACGGAIYIGACTLIRQMLNSTFADNSASNAGGAIYGINTSLGEKDAIKSFLIDLKFIRNTSTHNAGGALRFDSRSQVVLDSLEFSDNEWENAGEMGVGANLWDGTNQMDADPAVSTLEIHDPELLQSWPGATINSEIQVTESLMENSRSFRKSTEPREISAIVLHHISAINWESHGFQDQFSDRIAEFIASCEGIDLSSRERYKYDWRLCKEILELYGFSSHYMIGRDGTIYQLVEDRDVAYHAGKSVMPVSGRENVNDFSIGIELISSHPDDDLNVTSKETAYTDAQYESLDQLLLSLMLKYRVSLQDVVGHEDIAGANVRSRNPKKDPGPLFDWLRVRDRIRAKESEYDSLSELLTDREVE